MFYLFCMFIALLYYVVRRTFSGLFVIPKAFCTWIDLCFCRFKKLSFMILLKILYEFSIVVFCIHIQISGLVLVTHSSPMIFSYIFSKFLIDWLSLSNLISHIFISALTFICYVMHYVNMASPCGLWLVFVSCSLKIHICALYLYFPHSLSSVQHFQYFPCFLHSAFYLAFLNF